jgi:hypothetical protein
MPSLDRPNSDNTRVKLLRTAFNKAQNTPPAQLAFTPATLAELTTFLPNFEAELQERGTALTGQTTATGQLNASRRMLHMFITHFFRVFNFAVARGQFAATDRGQYQLDVSSDSAPLLPTDADLTMWAGRIVSGEAVRVAAGGTPMAFPTAAEVAGAAANFQTIKGAQSQLKDVYNLEQEDVEGLRPAADDLIDDIIDEVLFANRKHTPASARRNAREYGLTYVPSPGETPTADDFSLMGRVNEEMNRLGLEGVEAYIPQLDLYATTDIDGRYYFGVMPAGLYTVRFRKDGFMEELRMGITITDGVLTTLDVEMRRVVPPMP